jgi:hypothetical protein
MSTKKRTAAGRGQVLTLHQGGPPPRIAANPPVVIGDEELLELYDEAGEILKQIIRATPPEDEFRERLFTIFELLGVHAVRLRSRRS